MDYGSNPASRILLQIKYIENKAPVTMRVFYTGGALRVLRQSCRAVTDVPREESNIPTICSFIVKAVHSLILTLSYQIEYIEITKHIPI